MLRILSLLCFALWAGTAVADCKVEKIADLPVTMAGYPLVDATIDGTTLRFIADSGAFFSLISPAVAAQLRLSTSATPLGMTVEGIGGQETAELSHVKKFEIAGSTLHGVDFLVAGNGLGPGVAGALGQNILGYADVEYDLANGIIRLWRTIGCGNRMLAYWAGKDQPVGELSIEPLKQFRQTIGEATINGHKVRATFDTGSNRSYVLKDAARRAGVDTAAPDLVEAGRMTGGVGAKTFPTFIAPVQSFEVGGEEIHNTHLRLGDANLPNSDMLIGADFFLSHRIFVSNALQRMYFTYNGGPVFDVSVSHRAATPTSTDSTVTAAPQTTAITDADTAARRGDASAARGNYQDAIADLTRARGAAPKNPDYAYDRARAYLGNRQSAEALADLNDAVRLKPDDVPALMLRAQMRVGHSDESDAIADVDAAARVSAKEADTRLALAEIYMSARAPTAAIPQFDLWLTSHPIDVQRTTALNGRCRARALLDQELMKALADCGAALRSNNKLAPALDSRGLVYLRLGQFDKAIADYNAALAINPKIAWSLYGRGVTELRQGKTRQGAADIAAATSLAPKLPAIAKGYGVAP